MLLIDTHTHFDVPEYDKMRESMAQHAHQQGVRHLVLIGLVSASFEQMIATQKQLASLPNAPKAHLAFGLHPLYINEQNEQDLLLLDDYLTSYPNIAISEIGLDTYPEHLREPQIFAKQRRFFCTQIELAKQHQLPILMHIRKSHADVLRILKDQNYKASELGGIAHSFSGGEQEAFAFVKMGFKLGITGQITNPNAKKLRHTVMATFERFGVGAFVIETDCPDMMPVPCQGVDKINEPANLTYVFDELAVMFAMDKDELAYQLWQNSCDALRVNWEYN